MQSFKSISVLILSFGFFTGCESSTSMDPELMSHSEQYAVSSNPSNSSSITANKTEKNSVLATLQRATARYHNVDTAIGEGFVQAMPCQENSEGEGGLGIPFINIDRLDGIIDPSEPEVLFYEPQKNGKLRLIGVEPVVPVNLWPLYDPPSLLGHQFHHNDEEGLYGLHIWLWKHNPNGVTAFWHSGVSCGYAED